MRRGLILFIFVALAATVSMAQLSGTYYIPQGANPQGFANLTAAFNAVTTGGLSANTTFLIDADQNIADSLILSRSDLGPTKTLTIRPAPTKTVTITVTTSVYSFWNLCNGALVLNATGYVTIDGCNTPGGTTQNLTLADQTTAVSDGAIQIGGACPNLTLKNFIITADGDGFEGIEQDGDVGSGTATNLMIDNVTVGSLTAAYSDGIALWGNDMTIPTTGVVKNCNIMARRRGITTFYVSKNLYENNTIQIVRARATRGFYTAIYITGGGDNPDTLWIRGNKVTGIGINNTAVTAFGAAVTFYGFPGLTAYIENNFFAPNFSAVMTPGAQTLFGVAFGGNWGIGGGTCNINYNTFVMNSSTMTGHNANVGLEMVGLQKGEGFNLNMMNNIFVQQRTDTAAFNLYFPATNIVISSDYNDVVQTGSASAGYYQTGKNATLTDWQNASFQDLNSKSRAVTFVSATDLHLAGGSVGDRNLTGTPLASVLKDIDGQTRSVTTPYMGADEGNIPLKVIENGGVPTSFTLQQNYPNPFNPSTQIQFTLTGTAQTTLKVYDLLGREVATLVNEQMHAGNYTATFSAKNLTSGTYVYVLTSGSERLVRKMILLK